MKTVHGPEAHVTKKQRSDAPPRLQICKAIREAEPHSGKGAVGSDGQTDARSTCGVDDRLQARTVKAKNPVVSCVECFYCYTNLHVKLNVDL